MTNADRYFRNATDEEIADMISAWLKQEASDDADNDDKMRVLCGGDRWETGEQ